MKQAILRPECGSKKNLANENVKQGLVDNDRPFTKSLASMQLEPRDTTKCNKHDSECIDMENYSFIFEKYRKGQYWKGNHRALLQHSFCSNWVSSLNGAQAMPNLCKLKPYKEVSTLLFYSECRIIFTFRVALKQPIGNTVSVIVFRKRDTPLVLQLIYNRKYMGAMGKQQAYRKLTREHNGNKMIVYDVLV